MWQAVKSWLGFTADLITVLLVLPGIWSVLSNLNLATPLKIAFGLLLVGAVALVLPKFLKERAQGLQKTLRQERIKADTDRIQHASVRAPLGDILPTAKVLNRWIGELNIQARQWDKKAKVWGINFYLELSGSEVKPKMQGHYYSEWKELEAYFYVGSLSGSTFSDTSLAFDFKIKPFTSFRKWREAVLKAYEKISDQLPQEYQLSIHSYDKDLHIDFEYRLSGVKKAKQFIYDGHELVDQKTKQKEVI
jgi:hypothetical protein